MTTDDIFAVPGVDLGFDADPSTDEDVDSESDWEVVDDPASGPHSDLSDGWVYHYRGEMQ